jgi:hypothetical protein
MHYPIRAEQKPMNFDKDFVDVSMLMKKPPELSIKRDLFSPDLMTPRVGPNAVTPPVRPPEPKIEESQQVIEKNIEAETRSRLFFEGYVIKNLKRNAMVTVNGEYIIVGIGDVVLENVKIIKIEKKAITVEVDTKVFEIQLKGDNENV